jgi:thiol-disulfide isomerase/thioredoxin
MTPNYCLLPLLLALAACEPVPADATRAATGTKPADAATAADAKPTEAAAPVEAAASEKPALKIATLDGAQYDLASKRGRWVVVNFWATWCAPCIKEMPELDAFDAERTDVEVIGLAYEDIAVDDMRAFLKKRPVKYPIALVDTYDPPADFPTPRGLPMTYVIAPDGSIAKAFMGPVTGPELAAIVDGAAGKAGAETSIKAPTKPPTTPAG